MATPYKVKSFTIANGATESSVILHDETHKALAIARIDITGALTAQTAWIESALSASSTYKKSYDEYGTQLTFNIAGDRLIRMKLSDYAVVFPAHKIVLTGAASGAVTGSIYYREVE